MFTKADLREGSLVNVDLADSDLLGTDAIATVRVVEVPKEGAVKAMICEEVPQYFFESKKRGDHVWFAPCEIIEIVRK